MNEIIAASVKKLFDQVVDVSTTRPDPQFGDWATNVAMQLAKPLGRNPREIAEELAADLREVGKFSEVTVAGPGFINIRLDAAALLDATQKEPTPFYAGRNIVLEYSCPNAFKELHTGHLYQTLFAVPLPPLNAQPVARTKLFVTSQPVSADPNWIATPAVFVSIVLCLRVTLLPPVDWTPSL